MNSDDAKGLADQIREVLDDPNTTPETRAELERLLKGGRTRSCDEARGDVLNLDGSPHDPEPIDVAQEVFQYWAALMGKERTGPRAPRLTAKRRGLIHARLREGYDIETLHAAICGCSLSPFHTGDNESGTRYDGLELIMRNGENVERFAAMAAEPPRRNPKAQQGPAARAARSRASADAFARGEDES